MGQILHARQDFFSHSNFVDLSADDQRTLLSELGIGGATSSSQLKLCAYFRSASPPGAPPGDEFTHDAFSKDNSSKNTHARERLPRGATRFEQAREIAIENSVATLNELRQIPGAQVCFSRSQE
ncbi:hypothetical protein D7Y23_08005 [Corallococcus sp. AB050B]|nr:hypothetical protein D7Y23_08005 [Corallococcus sp. AB050B]